MAPILKDMGYKKNRLTWFGKLEELTIVFNIQKSQYADDIWYYQYGIGIHDLAGDRISSISKCDILCRFDQTINGKKLQTEDLRWILERWSEKYGSLERLRAADSETKKKAVAVLKGESSEMSDILTSLLGGAMDMFGKK